MKTKLTQEWLLERLRLLNTNQLEIEAGLTHSRISDVKRSKAKLSEDELKRIEEVLEQLRMKSPHLKNLEIVLKELYARINIYTHNEEWEEITAALDKTREALRLVDKLKKEE